MISKHTLFTLRYITLFKVQDRGCGTKGQGCNLETGAGAERGGGGGGSCEGSQYQNKHVDIYNNDNNYSSSTVRKIFIG